MPRVRWSGAGVGEIPDGHRWMRPQKSGSELTRQWREPDSNFRFPVAKTVIGVASRHGIRTWVPEYGSGSAGTEGSNPSLSSGESTANPVGLAQVEWPVRRRRSPWQAQRCGWRILAAFRAWPNLWHNKTVGPLPQTGVIGFKLTASATRHTSTQDRPAPDVSLLYYDRHNDLSAESRHDRPCHA